MSAAGGLFNEPTLEAIFYHEIVPIELEGPEPTGDVNPRIVIRTGQPGADLVTPRRIGLLDQEWAADAGYVLVPTQQTLESYHENWVRLHDAALSGDFGAKATLVSAARLWQDMALEWARTRGCHTFLRHLPPQDPGRLQRVARSFAAAGYDVRVVVAAVPAALSRLAAMEYSTFAASGGLRGTLPDGHDLAYRAVPQTARTAESCQDVHAITVIARDGIIENVTRTRSGEMDRPGAAYAAAERARKHSFTDIESVALSNRVIHILQTLDTGIPEAAQIKELGQKIIDDLIASDGGLADSLGRFRAQRALLAEHGIGPDPLDPGPAPDTGPEP